MQDIISNFTSGFTDFLNQNEKILKSVKKTEIIISYVVKTEGFSLKGKIDELLKNAERSFYFEYPEKKFCFIAQDEILDITEKGDRRFSATDKTVKGFSESLVTNREITGSKRIPLFLGGMKFMVEHPDNDWTDFEDSTWFIPKILILINEKGTFFIFNFLHNTRSSYYSHINFFQKKLDYLLSLQSKKELPALPKIRKYEADTPKEKKKWKQIVNTVIEEIENQRVDKVVLARRNEFLLTDEPSLEGITSKLVEKYPGCSTFFFHFGKSYFFGASPETIGRFSNNAAEFDALAGSAPRGKDKKEDDDFEKQLLSSDKDIEEHNIVIEYIKNNLASVMDEIEIKNQLSVKKLSNIQHLHTVISSKIKPGESLLSIIKEIYPTPAVCGSPKDEALHLIKKLENFKRGLYSGIIGWFNFENEGDFVVALRSAISIGTKIIAYAGSGIVKNSDPNKEFLETELKLKPVMTLFNDEI
ncbi:MAG TPA: isochorismate synthase [Ignavibacteriaceae bacterium]|nr:isochorismate synthase [Ignavibacteriaceae bacterium]